MSRHHAAPNAAEDTPARNRPPEALVRGLPRQSRSSVTVDNLLDAALRLADARDAAPDTNAIAERAGYSVGTLYRYFANKDEILRACIARELRRVLPKVLQVLDSESHPSLHAMLERLACVMSSSFGRRAAVRRVVFGQLRDEQVRQIDRFALERIAEALAQRLHRGEFPGVAAVSPIQARTVVHATAHALRRALASRQPPHEVEEMKREAVRMAHAYLCSHAGPAQEQAG